MQVIHIQTAQHVRISYELASYKERLLALSLDIFLVMVCYIGLFLWIIDGNLEFETAMIFQVLWLPLMLVYQFLSETLGNGQSVGKYIAGVKIIKLDGKPANTGEYLLRTFFHLVDTLGSLGVIGSFLISSTPRKQRLGDITAGTVVIKFRHRPEFLLEQLLRRKKLQDHQPVYLQVVRLGESDILLIRDALDRYYAFPNLAHKEAIELLVVRLQEVLDIPQAPSDKLLFLKTLMSDYLVLTR